MEPHFSQHEAMALISRVCDGQAAPNEVETASRRLVADERFRRFYLEVMDVESEIVIRQLQSARRIDADQERSGVLLADPFAATKLAAPRTLLLPTRGTPSFLASALQRPLAFSFVVATVVTVLILLMMAQVPISQDTKIAFSNNNASRQVPVFAAQLTNGRDCVWRTEHEYEKPFPGDWFEAGRQLELAQGVAEFTFNSGAVALVEGPALFVVEGNNRGRLDAGRLMAKVEKRGAAGFTVATPSTTIVDLGTEFLVTVDAEGTAEVQVYVGRVRLFSKQSDDSLSNVHDLKEGKAVRVVAASHDGPVRVEPMAFDTGQRLRIDEPKPVKLFVRSARASSVHNVELYIRGPENLIHNNGLTGDRHYNLPERTMWHSRLGRVKNEFVIFDLGQSCRLDRMKVWNYNEATHRLYISRGVKEADIYLSLDGKGDPLSAPEAWSLAVRNFQFNPADGTEDYSTPDVVPLEGATARYAAIVIHDHLAPDPRFPHDPYEQCVGLSEVQFFGHPLEELEGGKKRGTWKENTFFQRRGVSRGNLTEMFFHFLFWEGLKMSSQFTLSRVVLFAVSLFAAAAVHSAEAATLTIMQDSFTGTGVSNDGRSPDVVNLPGSVWQPGGTHDGNWRDLNNNRVELYQNCGAGISIVSAGSYTKPDVLNISVLFNLGTGSTATSEHFARGVGLGFFSALTTGQNSNGFDNFTGLVIFPATGEMRLLVDGAGTGITAAYTGTWDPNTDHSLSYTVDLTTGSISNILIDGQSKTINTTAFTQTRTQLAGFYAAVHGQQSSFFDNFLLTTPAEVPEPSSAILCALGALALVGVARRNKHR